MSTSVRLSANVERLVARIARQRHQSKSEVIRNALAALEKGGLEGQPRRTPYESMKHIIGCASRGPPDLSLKTGEKFRALLRKGRRSQ